MIAKTLAPSLGFDTSENLTLAQYQFLKSQGFAWACRYVPLAGQSLTSPGVISASELAAALSVMGLMFVQFAQEKTWTAEQGLLDGQAAGAYVLGLGVPATTCLWLDMSPMSTVALTTDYANAWYEGAVQAGMAASAPGVYFEPGCPHGRAAVPAHQHAALLGDGGERPREIPGESRGSSHSTMELGQGRLLAGAGRRN